MDALDIIPLDLAKDYLVVDFGDQDTTIERLIKTAVAMVEKYTGYRLYERDVEYDIYCRELEISDYPITINNQAGTYQVKKGAQTLYITATTGTTINATVGYDEASNIPSPLVDGAMKILVYLYERRDINMANLPIDVQMLLNPYRRSATI